MNDEQIEKTVDTKIKVAFDEAVGSQQIKTSSTYVIVEIMKDQEYVQKLGAVLLNNEHVF